MMNKLSAALVAMSLVAVAEPAFAQSSPMWCGGIVQSYQI